MFNRMYKTIHMKMKFWWKSGVRLNTSPKKPSRSTLELFEQLYFLIKGMCGLVYFSFFKDIITC